MICGKEKQGIRIKDDYVIGTLRWFKRNVTRNEQNNTIVVCKECYPKYSGVRKKYLSRQVTYLAIGVAFLVVGLLISPSLGTAGLCVFVLLFLYLLSMFNYVPSLDIKKTQTDAKK